MTIRAADDFDTTLPTLAELQRLQRELLSAKEAYLSAPDDSGLAYTRVLNTYDIREEALRRLADAPDVPEETKP